MRPTWASVLLCTVAAPSVASTEGIYFGGTGFIAERAKYDDVDDSFGGKAFVGFRIPDFPIFFEASYLDTGDADVDEAPGATDHFSMSFDGYTLGVGAYFPVFDGRSSVWIKGQYYDGDTKIDVPAGSIPGDPTLSGKLERSANGGGLAFGMTWKFSDYVGLRMELEQLYKMEDFVEDETVTMVGAGLVIEFPTGARPQEPPHRMPARTVDSVSSSPSPAPRPLMTAPPAAAASDRVASPTALKSQPRATSPTVALIPAGESVPAIGQASNPEGRWRFVQYGKQQGWIPESALATTP